MSRPADPRALELFDEVCDLPPEQRAAVLDERCAGDPQLRAFVERMLEHDADADERSSLAAGEGAGLLAKEIFGPDAGEAPTHIGRYRIVREIGRGGMGVVYEAEQESPRRRVAVKVMRQAFASAEAKARFRREAHVLGQLQHPGIAHVYEAGAAAVAAADCPFIAMEYIDGERIDHHADALALGVPERLELMARVCDAVQHAHQKGVLHRDLKAANVLVVGPMLDDAESSSGTVDPIGRPKVLDFGVARLTGAEPGASLYETTDGRMVGTLACMSPEQLAGDPALTDTRTDVYALGVMLYALLAGRMPFDVAAAGPAEAMRIIRDVDPTRLGAVNPRLRGDVETIVAKALDKNPDRRYAAAAELADDLRRRLRDEPILARRASTAYRLAKFARRNKALVAGAAATTLALVAGLVVSIALLISVAAERDARQRALDDATDVTEYFTAMLTAASPEAHGRDVTVREMLDDAARSIKRRFADRPALEAKIRRTVGETYLALGQTDDAERQLTRAIALLDGIDRPDRLELLHLHVQLGVLRRRQADYDAALASFEAAAALAPPGPEGALAQAVARIGRAKTLIRIGRLDEAATALAVVIDELDQSVGLGREAALDAREGLAEIAALRGEERAEPMYQELIADAADALGPAHPRTLVFKGNLAAMYRSAGRGEEALPLLRELLDAQTALLGPAHRETLVVANNLADVLSIAGATNEARSLLRDAIDTAHAEHGEDNASALFLTYTLGKVLRRAGELDEAERVLLDCAEAHRRIQGPAAEGTYHAEWTLQKLYIAKAKWSDAIELGRAMLAREAASFGDDHPRVYQLRYDTGRAYLGAERFDEAEAMFTATLEHASPGWKGAAERALQRLEERRAAAEEPTEPDPA